MMVSDWLWVSRERALGDNLTFYPYSSALGAVMVPAQSPIRTLADLKGKKLAVAGGPLDKSWLLLQALATPLRHRSQEAGDDRLWRAAAAGRERRCKARRDATLDILEFLRRSREPRASAAPIGMDDVMKGLGAKGAGRHGRLCLRRGLGGAQSMRRSSASSQAARKAKEHSRRRRTPNGSGSPRSSASTDARALAIYRQRYRRRHSVRRPIAEEEADARALYRVLAEIGGAELVGPAHELAAGTFYRPAAGE